MFQLEVFFVLFVQRLKVFKHEMSEFGLSKAQPSIVQVSLRPQHSDHHEVLVSAEKVEFLEKPMPG